MSSSEEEKNIDDLEKTLLLVAANADRDRSSSQTCSEEESTPKEPANRKRKHEENEEEKVETPKHLKTNEGYAKVVANHYNLIEEKGLAERNRSRIVHMRNFHNWIKSMLINEYLGAVKDSKKHNAPIRVLDLCCGKGGDLLKWRKGGITYLICADIAKVSLEQCEQRYTEMKNRGMRERGGGNLYSIEYIAEDCTKVRLREKYKDPSLKVDLVSCQFAFHYSFESLPQAEMMLRNASECLNPGGFFIGTIPDSNDLIARAKRNNTKTFGNSVFQVKLDFDINKPPLFGAKYDFELLDAVNCPEFLVHMPTFIKLAKKYGLKFVRKEKFYNYFERTKSEGKRLLTNMKSLETYPPNEGTSLLGTEDEDYAHASAFIEKKQDNIQIGTLSKSEWEASSLYMTFVFEKVKNSSWNADGTPIYNL